MSEVVRSYSRKKRRRQRNAQRRAGCLRLLLLLLVLAMALLWAVWTTRDSYPMARLIPADQNWRIWMGDILRDRQAIAQTDAWNLLPPDHPARTAVQELSSGGGMPEWLLTNLFNDMVHVSGLDTAAFSDPVIVTRMSRIGCLAEKCHRFYPGIDSDYAGGLRLRHLPEMNIYYAVRGRVLLISPSREALVRSLTLTPDNAISLETVRGQRQRTFADPLFAQIELEPSQAPGGIFEKLELIPRIGQDQILIEGSALFEPQMAQQLSGLIHGTEARPLSMPAAGYIEISADFNRPLPEVWRGIDQAISPYFDTTALSGTVHGYLTETNPDLGAFTSAILEASGSGIRLSWTGVDQFAMFPMPEFAATLDADTAALTEYFAALPAPLEGLPELESIPRYDPDPGIAYVPMIGGPSIEPSFTLRGDMLICSNSRTVVESIMQKNALEAQIEEPANLLIQIHPEAGLEDFEAAVLPFAELGLIKGYSSEAFREWLAPWRELAGKIDEIGLRLKSAGSGIQFTCWLKMKAS